MHEPRGKTSLTLAYSVSPTGADHMEATHDPAWEGLGVLDNGLSEIGLIEPVDRLDMAPAEGARLLQLADAVGPLQQRRHVRLRGHAHRRAQAAAAGRLRQRGHGLGHDRVGADEGGREVQHHGAALQHLREGFTRADDNLPERMFEPLQNGKLEGVAVDRDEFDQHACRSTTAWPAGTSEGVPTLGKLAELDLLWTAEKEVGVGTTPSDALIVDVNSECELIG